MKYTREQRLEIGKRIASGELNAAMAAIKYDINMYTARDYLRLYKANESMKEQLTSGSDSADIRHYEQMSKEELIQELLKTRKSTELVSGTAG